MAATKEIGVAVIGLGIAGKVRVRDLQEKTCGLTLRGVVTRREVSLPDVNGMSLEEALGREDIQAVMICTENKLHEEYVRRSLESGKHVLVDYPIALSSAKAKDLYALAEEKGLILHEESIALLVDSHLLMKAKAEKNALKSGSFCMKGGFNGWIENTEESGSLFISGISTLHVLTDLYGDLTVVSGRMAKDEHGLSASACLETLSGMPINVSASRSKGTRREKTVSYEFQDGEIVDPSKLEVPPPATPKPGLFMQDMLMFHRAIMEGKNDKAARDRSVKCLEIAEKIESFF